MNKVNIMVFLFSNSKFKYVKIDEKQVEDAIQKESTQKYNDQIYYEMSQDNTIKSILMKSVELDSQYTEFSEYSDIKVLNKYGICQIKDLASKILPVKGPKMINSTELKEIYERLNGSAIYNYVSKGPVLLDERYINEYIDENLIITILSSHEYNVNNKVKLFKELVYYINTKGEIIYSSEFVDGVKFDKFYNGYCRVSKNNKLGIINTEGEELYGGVIYSNMNKPTKNSNIAYIYEDNSDTVRYMKPDGTELRPDIIKTTNNSKAFYKGFAAILREDNTPLYIDEEGNEYETLGIVPN